MSSTRYANNLGPLAQERYMSSPEFAELRGISGNAVAAKAALMLNDQVRSLLHFLQALSLQQGGVKKVAADFLATFPGQLGSRTMHQQGIKVGGHYSQAVSDAIAEELEIWDEMSNIPSIDEILDTPPSLLKAPKRTQGRTVQFWIDRCRAIATEKLPDFLVQLCINPKVRIWDRSANDTLEVMQTRVLEEAGELGADEGLRDGSVPFFKNVVPALFEFQRLHSKRALSGIVQTEVAVEVCKNLDFCLAKRKMVVIEGESRIGKSTAAEAWANANLGRARFVSLSGVTHKTGFFRAIARALGIASSAAKTATDMQARVEDVLQRTRLAMVFDEAHFLWPQGERLYTRPELVDWVDTALFNHRVPVALICTPQFTFRMQKVEKQTGWNADQFKGRVGRYVSLPAAPSEADLEAVALKLFPESNGRLIDLVVGYAMSSKRHLPAVVDLADEARFLAAKQGRDAASFNDVKAALDGVVIPSDKAKAVALNRAAPSSRRRVPNSH